MAHLLQIICVSVCTIQIIASGLTERASVKMTERSRGRGGGVRGGRGPGRGEYVQHQLKRYHRCCAIGAAGRDGSRSDPGCIAVASASSGPGPIRNLLCLVRRPPPGARHNRGGTDSSWTEVRKAGEEKLNSHPGPTNPGRWKIGRAIGPSLENGRAPRPARCTPSDHFFCLSFLPPLSSARTSSPSVRRAQAPHISGTSRTALRPARPRWRMCTHISRPYCTAPNAPSRKKRPLMSFTTL